MSLTRAADHIDDLDIAAALRSGANVAALVRDLTRAQGVSFTASPLGAFAGAVLHGSPTRKKSGPMRSRTYSSRSRVPASSPAPTAWRFRPHISAKRKDDLRPLRRLRGTRLSA